MAISYTPEEITEILNDYFSGITHKQYIGARYVPIFGRKGEDSIAWDNTAPYEPLTIVLYQGNSFTSRQFVPTGIDINNELYWAETGNYNAQVEAYRREVLAVSDSLDDLESKTLLPNNPIKYGADPTGVAYSDDAFQTAIENSLGTNLDITPGTYRFSRTLKIPGIPENRVDIDFRGSKLVFDTLIDACIEVGYDLTGSIGSGINQCVLTNFSLINNYPNNDVGILFDDYSKSFRVNNFEIIGILNNGIQIGSGDVRVPGDIYLDNFNINLQDSSLNNQGITIYNTDCKINNGFIKGCRNCFNVYASAIFIDNVHGISAFDDLSVINDIPTSFVLYNTHTIDDVERYGNHVYMSNCYCDAMKSFVRVIPAHIVYAALINCKYYSYLADLIEYVFDFRNATDYGLTWIGGEITLNSNPENRILFKRSTSPNAVRNIRSNTNIIQPIYDGNVTEQKVLGDPFKCYNKEIFPYSYNLSLEPNTWYKVGYISMCHALKTHVKINLSGERYVECDMAFGGTMSNGVIQNVSKDHAEIGFLPVTDTDNMNFAEIYVKHTWASAIDSYMSVTSDIDCLGNLSFVNRTLSTLATGTPTITSEE